MLAVSYIAREVLHNAGRVHWRGRGVRCAMRVQCVCTARLQCAMLCTRSTGNFDYFATRELAAGYLKSISLLASIDTVFVVSGHNRRRDDFVCTPTI